MIVLSVSLARSIQLDIDDVQSSKRAKSRTFGELVVFEVFARLLEVAAGDFTSSTGSAGRLPLLPRVDEDEAFFSSFGSAAFFAFGGIVNSFIIRIFPLAVIYIKLIVTDPYLKHWSSHTKVHHV